jgi:predicted deacetylase
VSARLVVSLSGIGTRTLHRCAELAGELDLRGVSLSLLFAPRVAGLGQPSVVVDWVRQRRAQGDALLLHGFDLTDAPRRRAEFGSLPAHEAGLRLTAARRTMENHGLELDSFAPPQWAASPGTLTALRRNKFVLCADMNKVYDLRNGDVHKGRVHGLQYGERVEPWSCFALVLGIARAARRGGLVRLSVEAADLARPGPRRAILDAIDIATHHGAEPTTYQRTVASPRVSTRTSVSLGPRSANLE